MTAPAVPVVLVAPALAAAAAAVFPEARLVALAREEMRPARPFEGRLFAALAALPAGTCVGLVVPLRVVAATGPSPGGQGVAPAATGGAGERHTSDAAERHTTRAVERRASGESLSALADVESPPGLVAVEDHVNLELCGPLTGPWPAGVPRGFPSMTGRYQPSVIRSAAGPRVYSGGVVAGVGDLARLTPFERAALRCAGCLGAADLIVPPAVAAAYHGHTLAACGVVQGPPIDEE
ncbi:MAG TPA: hypothetical protein VLA35_06520 [Thermoleophilia bacterium]|nr:hypothetical protein [Thermoleophilia bacterium]